MRVRRIGMGVTALTCAVALALGVVVVGGGPLAAEVAPQAFTVTTSTSHPVTVVRVDLPPAPAPECDFPGSGAAPVDETRVPKELITIETVAVGPADIMIGEDQLVPHHVNAGDINTDTNTVYETVVTQYFQAVEPGPPCAAVLVISFTG